MDNAFDTLSCPCFASAPGRHQLYLTEAHRDHLAMIKAWTKFDRGLLVLSGPARIGKTVLTSEFIAQSSGDMKIGRVTLDRPGMDLSQEAPKAFGISSPDPLTELTRLLEKGRSTYRKCVLIVDNAHLLSEPSKEFLEEITAASGLPQPLYVLLVGRGEAAALLDPPIHEELRRRIGGHLRMQPLTQAETAAYITHRFRVRKCPCHGGRQPFDAGGLWLIHEASGGNPGQIDRLVRHCLSRERMAPGGRMDEVYVHACLSDLAQAGTLPHPLPDLPAGGYRDEAASIEEPAAPPSFPEPYVGTAPAGHVPLLLEEPPARRWQTPALAGAAVIGLVAIGGYVLTPDRAPVDQAAETPAVAVQAPEAATPAPAPIAPEPVAEPAPRQAAIVTEVEENAPDAQILLTQALEADIVDQAAALALYKRAALWGNERAAYYLGQLYETGIGVEADPNSARAWYRKAPDISGAVARLRELDVADPSPAEVPGMPTPNRQTILTAGQSELYWSAPDGPDPVQYRVEFNVEGSEQIEQIDTDLTAALIEQPVARWRVAALRADGTPGPASDWAVPTAP